MSKPPINYSNYLQIDRLLDCQALESTKNGKTAHDEMLFIIVHQAYELWFKQILWEVDAVLKLFGGTRIREQDVAQVVAHLSRVVTIQRVLLQQVDILETMTPLDFLDFRDQLIPASGFQSMQFRLLENKLGLRPQDRTNYTQHTYSAHLPTTDRAKVEAAEQAPSLFDGIDRWLARTPFLQFGDFNFWEAYQSAVGDMLAAERAHLARQSAEAYGDLSRQYRQIESTAAQFEALFDAEKYAALRAEGMFRLSHEALKAALLINLYRSEPILHLPFRVLSLLMDVDENFTTWRYRHSLMVLRMIGAKIGTGGSSGHDYLRMTAERHKVYKDLFSLSTFFIPRSALPTLPEAVRRTLGFHYEGLGGK